MQSEAGTCRGRFSHALKLPLVLRWGTVHESKSSYSEAAGADGGSIDEEEVKAGPKEGITPAAAAAAAASATGSAEKEEREPCCIIVDPADDGINPEIEPELRI